MAVWVLARALEVLDVLPDQRSSAPGSGSHSRSARSRVGHHQPPDGLVFHADGVLSQFEGYQALKEFDWEEYRERYGHLYRLDFILESRGRQHRPLQDLQAAGRPDAVLSLLGRRARIALHAPRLSVRREPIPQDHRLLLRAQRARLVAEPGRRYVGAGARGPSGLVGRVHGSARDDVADIQGGTTPEGIHLGAMAGTVDVLQRCYTGIELRGDVLWLRPRLPKPLRRLRLFVRYRGQSLALELMPGSLQIDVMHCCAPAIRVGIDGQVHELAASESRRFPLP